MRTRISLVVLAAVLAISGCSSKSSTPQSPATEQAAQSAPAEQAAAPANAPANSTTPATTAAGTQPATPATEVAAAPAPKPRPKPIVIPAGTVITVRLGEQVGSKVSTEGAPFSASVSSPVPDSEGKVVIPTGAHASGVVTQAHPAGRFKGGATLALDLNSITIGGHVYPIHTAVVSETSKGKGKRTAGMVGGGAAGGALIGGLAGGGKGAGIGALVGAGAGVAGSAFTGNRDITLPAESALSFKLTQPIELKAKE